MYKWIFHIAFQFASVDLNLWIWLQIPRLGIVLLLLRRGNYLLISFVFCAIFRLRVKDTSRRKIQCDFQCPEAYKWFYIRTRQHWTKFISAMSQLIFFTHNCSQIRCHCVELVWWDIWLIHNLTILFLFMAIYIWHIIFNYSVLIRYNNTIDIELIFNSNQIFKIDWCVSTYTTILWVLNRCKEIFGNILDISKLFLF